ncbi:hypothetical protein ILUMI_25794 [Ignelater luminosus]|uniref:DNA polymerase n=1 Tax=Ignelater luminosus TaxID=2038154 RepID=A0A8K0FZK5_IGNLU|nr:hypothetical protein ILUMI_25794 [Ignelater luminosus]
MSDVAEHEPRAKRQKRERPQKTTAFEKLKQLKGSKHKYEVSDVENVYEVIDEKEYTKRVLDRQDDDWIVDDDGGGYVEDGRDIFDDDLDAESIAAASKEGTNKKRKKKAVSEQAVKGNLQFLLSNMPSKRKEEVQLGDDNILSELISEIDEDNSMSNSVTFKRATIKPKPISNLTLSADKRAAKDYMKKFSVTKSEILSPKQKSFSLINGESKRSQSHKNSVLETFTEKDVPNERNSVTHAVDHQKEECNNVTKVKPNNKDTECSASQKIEEFQTQEQLFDDGFDLSQIEEFPSQEVPSTSTAKDDITEEQLLSGWETMQEGTSNSVEVEINIDKLKIPTVINDQGKQVFRFFWWDAFEDPAKRPGEVFLFGKTYCEAAKAYVSCCVVVRNIERKLYLLPRTHHLDAHREPTDKPVALIDVYHEFNNNYASYLTLQSFKSRKVTKNYCFDPEVPSQSEYLEIRYSAKSPRLDTEICKIGGKTFSRVFGNRNNFLEILLLDCKIKGPCWLDISNPECVGNPVSHCKFEVNCLKVSNLSVAQTVQNKIIPPPPLVVATINVRAVVNPKTMNNGIAMMSVLVHTKYSVDKKPPNPMFEQHFCVCTHSADQMLPLDFHDAINKYKGTKVQKMDSERGLLNFFIKQLARIDADLIVGHDLQDYQIGLLCDRLIQYKMTNFSQLGKLKRSDIPMKRILERELFLGRLVCDVKISAKELIKSRSFDLETLCQTVLKLKEGERVEIDCEDIPKFYQTSSDLLRLITFTMQDSAFILKMMYELNAIPLALQITNIAGNIMSRTLLGGRSERNEYLLLHAFFEKDYIVPDKYSFKENENNSKTEMQRSTASKKKPTYSGGLVLDPKVGFYDKLVLLMDFNSLYPSIIQEYNICFTTIPSTSEEDKMVLPDQNLLSGILPTEIRKLVESRREVKKLMSNPDLPADLRMQYNIRQMALKLTANSMYGCLGFSNSRFYAKNLAALVTYKGREILTNTKDLVQKLSYNVIYGDTDSIMINTNCLEYDEVMKIGIKIKQEVNKLYKQVELDIDGVFKYLLLLKKKKYAAVTLTKDKNGELKSQQEHKGLDIVRRDWSQLAAAAGRFTLDNILNEQSSEDRIENIHAHLVQLKEDLEQNKVPLSLLVITKQLTKDPKLYADRNQLPHVQVALRYNKKGGRILKAGDTVPYVICDDGSNTSATQRAYHIEELKNSDSLKIDIKYYLAQQIHPVVSRLCEPLEGTDPYQIANCLGLDTSAYKKPVEKKSNDVGESLKKENKFLNVSPFVFICVACKTENKISGILRNNIPFLTQCANPECAVRPIDYLPSLQNQLTLAIRKFVKKYYCYEFMCEDPACTNVTNRLPLKFIGKYPICTLCKKAVMYRKYTERDLYTQLSYFQHIFDLSKLEKSIILEANVEVGYHCLKEVVEKTLRHSGYAMINLTQLYSAFLVPDRNAVKDEATNEHESYYQDDEYEVF